MMKKRKILAAALAAALAATSTAIPVLADEVDEAAAAQDEAVVETAEEAAEIADDGIALAAEPTWTHGGAGTKEDPYQISTREDLMDLSNFTMFNSRCFYDKYFKLMNDIDVSENKPKPYGINFSPIGWKTSYISYAATFHFDGDGHTITLNLENRGSSDPQGLFGYVEAPFSVENLHVSGTVQGGQYAGGVVGLSKGGTIKDVTCDCTVESNAVGQVGITTKYVGVGGIVGSTEGNDMTAIDNCEFSGTVAGIGEYNMLGGIVGDGNYANITGCENSGDISGDDNNNYIGGIVGRTNGTVDKCSNSGDVTNTRGGGNIGGVAGSSSIKGTLTNCTNEGTVSANTDRNSARVGGIVGSTEGNVSGSYNTGDVTVTGSGVVGGVVGDGLSGAKIKDVYNTGDVKKNGSGDGAAGGVVGRLTEGTPYNGRATVNDVFNTGNVSNDSKPEAAGGVAGKMGQYAQPENLGNTYYQEGSCGRAVGGETSEEENPPTGTGTFEELSDLAKDDKLGEGWNFDDGIPQLDGNPRELPTATEVGIYFKEHKDAEDDPEAGMLALTEALDTRTYDIVVRAAAGTEINELNTVDLKFVNNSAMDYEIAPAQPFINVIDAGDDRYEFNFDTKDPEVIKGYDSGHSIVVGTVTFLGYGKVDFSVDETAETNVVTTTKTADNIVNVYAAAGETGTLTFGKNDGSDDSYQGQIGGGDSTLEPDTREVQINLMFPNEVKTDKAADYTAMKVEVNGGVHEGASAPEPYSATIDLGELDEGESLPDGVVVDKDAKFKYNSTETTTAAEQVEVLDEAGAAEANANGYKITLDVPVPEEMGSRYTFKFSGKGYRTYTVDAVIKGGSDTAHVINVWNNVMDGDLTVTASDGFADVTAPVTFLAGDIDDSKHIDLYDLSAAVAYFGKSNAPTGDVTTYDDSFAQYDLNRDGNIDSKDIAMVLVSWGM